MPIKIKDPKVSFIEGSTDILSTITSYFPDYVPDGNVICPFHDDKQRSLHISMDGRMFCHGCKETAANLVEFVAKMEDLPYEETKEMLYNDIVNAVPAALIAVCHTLLLKNTKALEYLNKKRHIPMSTIKEFQLGYEPASNRIIIPVRDQFGACVNFRRMGWEKSHDKKVLNLKGKGECRLFPENKMILERRILLVEGEFDCLVARSLGFPAVTWTAGASNWNDKHTHLFRDKAVWILYDADSAGKSGGMEAARLLKGVTVRAMRYPALSKKGKDITDWHNKKSALKGLKEHIDTFVFPKRKVKKCYCPTCGQEWEKK